MRMPHVADRLFHRHKPDPDDPAPLFDSGIGDWLLELTAIALDRAHRRHDRALGLSRRLREN